MEKKFIAIKPYKTKGILALSREDLRIIILPDIIHWTIFSTKLLRRKTTFVGNAWMRRKQHNMWSVSLQFTVCATAKQTKKGVSNTSRDQGPFAGLIKDLLDYNISFRSEWQKCPQRLIAPSANNNWHSTISPKLFTLVLEDVFKYLQWGRKGINVDGKWLNNLCFAEDIILMSSDFKEGYEN